SRGAVRQRVRGPGARASWRASAPRATIRETRTAIGSDADSGPRHPRTVPRGAPSTPLAAVTRADSRGCASFQTGGQSWRRQELREFVPALRSIVRRPAPRFDVALHHVLPEVVVDHIAAVLIEEAYALDGAVVRHQGVALEPARGRFTRD